MKENLNDNLYEDALKIYENPDYFYASDKWNGACDTIITSLRSDLEQAIRILAYLKSHNNIQDSEIDALLDKYMDYPKEEK